MDSCSIACNSSARSCIKAKVTFGPSLVLSLGFAEGPVEVTVLDVDGFSTFSPPLFGGFVHFPFPAGPLPCPLEANFELEDLLQLCYLLQQLVVAK